MKLSLGQRPPFPPLVAASLFIVLAVLAGAVVALHRPWQWWPASRAAESSAGADQNRPRAPFRQTVRVWVQGDGLSPELIRVSSGNIAFRVENQTFADVSVAVVKKEKDKPDQIKGSVAATSRGKRARKEFDLEHGEYAFYLEGYPAFRGTLIVEKKP